MRPGAPHALGLASVVGVALFVWPFLGIGDPGTAAAVSIVLATGVALAAVELGARRLDSRGLALLGVLSALDAAARAALVTGLGGFSPLFVLVLCGGYVFGASFGFLLGATSLLVSALVTGGLGPWLPYQLFAVGWVGAVAGLVGRRRSGRPTWADVGLLATAGVLSGFGFGAAMDLWQWSFYRSSPGLGFVPGMGIGVATAHFARFYVATSAVYDSFRAVGNAVCVGVVGLPVLTALGRLRARRRFEVVALDEVTEGGVLAALGAAVQARGPADHGGARS